MKSCFSYQSEVWVWTASSISRVESESRVFGRLVRNVTLHRSNPKHVFHGSFYQSNSYKSAVPLDLPSSLVPHVRTYISVSDISLLSQALTILALLLELSPSVTFLEVEHNLLNEIYAVAHSPLVSGVALVSLFRFFAALVEADNQIATHVIPNLVIFAKKAPKA
jgi:hypothetical protein